MTKENWLPNVLHTSDRLHQVWTFVVTQRLKSALRILASYEAKIFLPIFAALLASILNKESGLYQCSARKYFVTRDLLLEMSVR